MSSVLEGLVYDGLGGVLTALPLDLVTGVVYVCVCERSHRSQEGIRLKLSCSVASTFIL